MKMLFQSDPCWQIPALEVWGLQALLLTRAACTHDSLRWGLWGLKRWRRRRRPSSWEWGGRLSCHAWHALSATSCWRKLPPSPNAFTRVSFQRFWWWLGSCLPMLWCGFVVWFDITVWVFRIILNWCFVIKKSIYWSFVAFLWSVSISYGWLEA